MTTLSAITSETAKMIYPSEFTAKMIRGRLAKSHPETKYEIIPLGGRWQVAPVKVLPAYMPPAKPTIPAIVTKLQPASKKKTVTQDAVHHEIGVTELKTPEAGQAYISCKLKGLTPAYFNLDAPIKLQGGAFLGKSTVIWWGTDDQGVSHFLVRAKKAAQFKATYGLAD